MLHDQEGSNAFVIGYGTGMTVGSLTQADNIAQIDVVEIEEAVYEAADKFFGPYTHDPHENPRVRRHVGDGRNFLMARGGQYGVIISEPPDIWVAGVANLFSHEFYQAVEGHLQAGGVFCQWVPLYHLRPSTIRMVYRTLNRTFPYVQVFVLANGNSIVIATKEPLAVSMKRLEQHFETDRTRKELLRVGLRSGAQLLALFAINAEELPAFTGTGDIHTDDNGALEFAAQSDYLFSIRTRENSNLLAEQLREAFAPYGSLDGLNLQLGAGEDRRRRIQAIATELTRVGKTERAAVWRQRAQP
jgi:spermidine synthase